MVWTASQMMDSYGNGMPESYVEQGRSEYVEFMTSVGYAEEFWAKEAGTTVEIVVGEYV